MSRVPKRPPLFATDRPDPPCATDDYARFKQAPATPPVKKRAFCRIIAEFDATDPYWTRRVNLVAQPCQ